MVTVASLLADQVTLRLSSVDRIGIGGYVRDLCHQGGLVKFLLHRAALVGNRNIPSPALLGHNHERLGRDLDRFVADGQLELVGFRRGDSKEVLARPYQLAAAAAGADGVVLVGKAQERMDIWRGWVDKSSPQASRRHPHFSFGRQSAVPDHWYFYIWDDQWGPAFIKLSTYEPYGLWIALNGHEWLKRQLANAGVPFSELDNGLRSVDDAVFARRLAARLGSGHIRGFITRWLPTLPSPLIAADRQVGFGWSFSVRQLEIADTAVFDRPAAGRAWFETAIRDHLDLGRPDKVKLVFDRKIFTRGPNPTPGPFTTQVIKSKTRARIEIRYKSARTKAYFKEGRALRVETTINNAKDFDLAKTLNSQNWQALLHAGDAVNSRFLAALGEGAAGLPDPATLERIVLPTVHDRQRAPGLRFGEPRVMALLASIAAFKHVTAGLTNGALVKNMRGLYDPAYTSRQATYDLRRLRLKGVIERVPGTHTYRVTAFGRTIATFFTRLAARVVVPALTALTALADTPRPPRGTPAPLAAAWRSYDTELRKLARAA